MSLHFQGSFCLTAKVESNSFIECGRLARSMSLARIVLQQQDPPQIFDSSCKGK